MPGCRAAIVYSRAGLFFQQTRSTSCRAYAPQTMPSERVQPQRAQPKPPHGEPGPPPLAPITIAELVEQREPLDDRTREPRVVEHPDATLV